jgi:Beta-glucan synthesis-associated protein SKN1/KRE6/Sbg1
MTINHPDGDGQLQLVFSDEFETDGRSFYPGDDPFCEDLLVFCRVYAGLTVTTVLHAGEALDLNYWGTE